MRDDYYELLGLNPDAPQSAVSRAYRRLALELHPDKGLARRNCGDVEAGADSFGLLREAYDVLSDPQSRRKYDVRRSWILQHPDLVAPQQQRNVTGGWRVYPDLKSLATGQRGGKSENPSLSPAPVKLVFDVGFEGQHARGVHRMSNKAWTPQARRRKVMAASAPAGPFKSKGKNPMAAAAATAPPGQFPRMSASCQSRSHGSFTLDAEKVGWKLLHPTTSAQPQNWVESDEPRFAAGSRTHSGSFWQRSSSMLT